MFGKKIVYYFIRFIIGWFKITPFFILYGISDFTYFILYYVAGYRKKVVIQNLKFVFPDKSKTEIKKITRKFYKNLADTFIESVKGLSMSSKEMLKRYKCINPDEANKYYETDKDIIALAAHYANWEWGAVACSVQFKFETSVLYKPLSNKFIDKYLREKRARFGVTLVPITKTKEYFISTKEKKRAVILVADQNPSNSKKAVWVDFLGIKTAFLHGPESYYKSLDHPPVVYFDIKRLKRGFYTFEVIDMTKEYKQGELTSAYSRLLENSIYNNPSDWLWSHKRWKKKYSDFLKENTQNLDISK